MFSPYPHYGFVHEQREKEIDLKYLYPFLMGIHVHFTEVSTIKDKN